MESGNRNTACIFIMQFLLTFIFHKMNYDRKLDEMSLNDYPQFHDHPQYQIGAAFTKK